ncbi:MAG: hypothetical protein ABSG13_27035 [Bryobacteraceae bacterium]
MFDQIRADKGGIERLRMLASKTEKRLSEELIPLAHFIQSRYREGYRLKVRWRAGNQSYDAKILASGVLVDQAFRPKELTVEITTAVHEKEHLVREHINAGEVSFGPKSMSRDKVTGKTVSVAEVNRRDETPRELAAQILIALEKKKKKKYPRKTVLIIDCIPNLLLDESEWQDALVIVKREMGDHKFGEIVLVERRGNRVTLV